MKSDSTIFFREFMDICECYTQEKDQLEFLKLVLKYGLGDDKITIERVPVRFKPTFISVKSIIDKTTEKYKSMQAKRSEAGRKGMETRWGNRKKYSEEEEKNFVQIIAGWNDLKLTQVKKLTEDRKENMINILQTYNLGDFAKVFDEIRASEFLRGHNKDMWCIDFDWLIKDDQHFTKVFEGTYKTRDANNNNEIEKIWNKSE